MSNSWKVDQNPHSNKTLSLGIFFDGLSLPPKEGITVHTYALATALANSHRVRVTFIAADRGRVGKSRLEQEPFDTILLPPDDYYSQEKVQSILAGNKFDLVQSYNNYYVCSVLGPVAESAGIPLVVEHHDLEADLSFLHQNHEQTKFHTHIQNLAIEYSALSRVMSHFDYSSLMKTATKALSEKLLWMPVAIPPVNYSGKFGQTVLFVGNMSYPPNKAAAVFIINNLAPLTPQFNYRIVGRGSKDLHSEVTSPNVELLGEVDDLGDVFSDSAVGIAPLSEGSGMKIKLITYLAAALPVVASTTALRGFPANPSLVEANSATEIAHELGAILHSNSHWEQLSAEANKLFAQKFNLVNSIDELITIYAKVAANTSPKQPIKNDILSPDMNMFPWHKELGNNDVATVTQPLYIKGTSS